MSVGVSVVICAYTQLRWSQLEAAVESVLMQEPRPVELVVVVDHCPELEHRVKERFGGAVKVMSNSFRQGLSGARNTGSAACTGDVVAFLDDDAYAERGWLAAHARPYEDQDVVGVGGLVVPAWDGREPPWFPPEFRWVVGCSYVGLPEGTAQIRNPIGANMSFRRHAVEAAGGFSEGLGRVGSVPLGCEETELSIRITARSPGSRIMHEPHAVVHHHVAPSRTRFRYFSRRCWAEGLSKAHVARLVGVERSLGSERSYVTTTLAAGVRGNLGRAVSTRDIWQLARAGAMVIGLLVTTAGFGAGRAGSVTTFHHNRGKNQQ